MDSQLLGTPKKKTFTKEFLNDTLDILTNGGFKKHKLLNRTENKVFWCLKRMVKTLNLPVFIAVQKPLGQFIEPDDPHHFRYYGRLTVDFCLYTKEWDVLAVIECHGKGHYGYTDKITQKVIKNDRIKKIMCDKVGILYHEVPANTLGASFDNLESEVDAHLLQRLVPLLMGEISKINAIRQEYYDSNPEIDALEEKKYFSNQGYPIAFDPWEADLLGCVHEDAHDDEDEEGNLIPHDAVILSE